MFRIGLLTFRHTRAQWPVATRRWSVRCRPWLTAYFGLFKAPILPSILARWLLTFVWSATAMDHAAFPTGSIPTFLTPSWRSFCSVLAALPPRSYTSSWVVAVGPQTSRSWL